MVSFEDLNGEGSASKFSPLRVIGLRALVHHWQLDGGDSQFLRMWTFLTCPIRASRGEEPEKESAGKMEVTDCHPIAHYFYSTLYVRNKSVGPAHTHGEQITLEHEY